MIAVVGGGQRDDPLFALHRALVHVSDPVRAAEMATNCQQWAGCFTWERSAELLAATVVAEMQRRHLARSRPAGRRFRSRLGTTTAAWFVHPDPAAVAQLRRVTDEVWSAGTAVTAILRGCDDDGAISMLEELGASHVRVRPASRHEIHGGLAILDPCGVGRMTVAPSVALLSVSAAVAAVSYACSMVMAHLLDPVHYTAYVGAAAHTPAGSGSASSNGYWP